ncbi:hypothetical protein [Micromonospora sp. NBC_00617]
MFNLLPAALPVIDAQVPADRHIAIPPAHRTPSRRRAVGGHAR